MIGNKFNYDNAFFRDLTVCVLDTFEGKIGWVNKFTKEDIIVNVPFYYSLTGDERFLLDSFTDDIVSENRFTEFNTDVIPRGHVTLESFNIRSDEFRNPNVWLRSVVEDNQTVKSMLRQLRAIPITCNYKVSIVLKSEIDVFKCSQSIMDTLWLYKFMYFEYNFLHIDAVITMPDSKNIDIVREKNLTSDNTIKLSFDAEVQTYYPAFGANDQIIAKIKILTDKKSKLIEDLNSGNIDQKSFDQVLNKIEREISQLEVLKTSGIGQDQSPSNTRWFNSIRGNRTRVPVSTNPFADQNNRLGK